MKKIYLVKKDPQRPAEQDNWIVMNSCQFAAFIKTPEGRDRAASFGKLEGADQDDALIFAECGAAVAKRWKSDINQAYYARKRNAAAGYTMFSYHGITDEYGGEQNGEELLRDEDENTEDATVTRLMQEKLHGVLLLLEEQERDLVEKLYLQDPPMTELQYAQAIGAKRTTIHYRKVRILEKLKRLIGEINE